LWLPTPQQMWEMWECLDLTEALVVRVIAPLAATGMLVVLAATGTLNEKSALALLAVLAGSRAPIRRGGGPGK